MKQTVVLISLTLLLGLLVACGNTTAPTDNLNNQAVESGSFELRSADDLATLEWADISDTTDTQILEATGEPTLSFNILEVEAGNGNLFVKGDTGFSVAGPGDDVTIQRFVEGDERVTLRLADDVSERISGGTIGLSVPVGDGEQNITVRGFVDGAVIETATITLSDLTEPTETSVPYPLQAAVDAIEFSQSGRNRFSLLESTFTTDLGAEPGQTQLEGEPGEPAAQAVSDLGYDVSQGSYSTDHPELIGGLVSFDILTLAFELTTTVAQANTILRDIGAEIVGGLQGNGTTEGILVLKVSSSTHEEMITLLAELRGDEIVKAASQDIILGEFAVPHGEGNNTPGWTWENPLTAGSGNANWNMERVRAPQLWNLNASIEKDRLTLNVGVLDADFVAHPDVPLTPPSSAPTSTHGTEVASVIGASFDNAQGIDGIYPYANLIPRSLSRRTNFTNNSFAQFITTDLPALWNAQQQPRVINISLGYNWRLNFNIDTTLTTSQFARDAADQEGLLFAITAASLWGNAPEPSKPIVIAAAGNDTGPDRFGVIFPPQDAQFASPFNNAAIRLSQPETIVVEAMDAALARSVFSNINGDITAPGTSIMVATQISAGIPSQVGGTPGYVPVNGTSFAAPLVAGVAAYARSLDPSLTPQEVRALLIDNAVPTGTGQNYVDAYASVIAVDELRENRNVLRRLLDIDDGTSDGNQRVLIGAESDADSTDSDNDGVVDAAPGQDRPLEYTTTDFGSVSGAEVVGEDVDGDGGVGDGVIDMADFRRWRDWYLQTSAQGELNGSATTFKKDVNSHAKAGSTPTVNDNEDVYPRGDFNGDGSVASATATAALPGFETDVTDLQVLQRSGLWDDVFYTLENLDGLLTSGDVEIWVRDLYTLDNVAGVRSYIIGDSSPNTRNHFPDFQRHVYTLAPGIYTALIQATDAAGNLVLELQKEFTVVTGGDELWAPLATLTPDIVSSYDGPLEDCPRLEGTFEYQFIGLFEGATPNIPILSGQTASVVINQSLFNLLEQEKNSNEPLNVTAKTVRNCNLAEGPNQELGLVVEYTDPATNTGFYAYLYDTFENIDNRWPAFTWNRTDLTANETICPPLLTDVFTTGIDGQPAEPQTSLGIEPGSFGNVLMRSATLYQQEFRDQDSNPIVAAQFSPGFLDNKFTYNGVEQWVHTVGAYAQPECDGGIGSSTSFGTQSVGDQFDGENSAFFTPMENPEQNGELRKGRGF